MVDPTPAPLALPRGQRFEALDTLRGIAAVVVMLVHHDLFVRDGPELGTFIGRSASYLAVDLHYVVQRVYADTVGRTLGCWTGMALVSAVSLCLARALHHGVETPLYASLNRWLLPARTPSPDGADPPAPAFPPRRTGRARP